MLFVVLVLVNEFDEFADTFIKLHSIDMHSAAMMMCSGKRF